MVQKARLIDGSGVVLICFFHLNGLQAKSKYKSKLSKFRVAKSVEQFIKSLVRILSSIAVINASVYFLKVKFES